MIVRFLVAVFVFYLLVQLCFIALLRSDGQQPPPPPQTPGGVAAAPATTDPTTQPQGNGAPTTTPGNNNNEEDDGAGEGVEGGATAADLVLRPYRECSPSEEAEGYQTQQSVLAVCHPDWKGIRAATHQLNLPVLEFYDLLQWNLRTLIRAVHQQRPEVLVVNGVPLGLREAFKTLHSEFPELRLAVVYHGSLAQTMDGESMAVKEILGAIEDDTVWRVGYVKGDGMAEFMRGATLGNLKRAQHAVRLGKYSVLDGRLHIGVFAVHTFLKNTINQIAAACSIPDATVHVTGIPAQASFLYDLCRGRIVEHSPLAGVEMQLIMSTMDLNLYVSLTECFPMVVLESAAVGVPCLTSKTHAIYSPPWSNSSLISNNLIAWSFEDVGALRAKIESIRPLLPALAAQQPALLRSANAHSQTLWHSFLNKSLCPSSPSPPPPPPSHQQQHHPYDYRNNNYYNDDGNNDNYDHRYDDNNDNNRKKAGKVEGVRKLKKLCLVADDLTLDGDRGTVFNTLIKEVHESNNKDNNGQSVEVVVYAIAQYDSYSAWLSDDYLHRRIESHRFTPPFTRKNIGKLKSVGKASFLRSRDFLTQFKAIHPNTTTTTATATPCDVIEFFDYSGLAFELLRHRKEILPPTTAVVVRAYGTVAMSRMIRDISDRGHWWGRQHSLVAMMERYSMFAADAVLVPSASLATFYSRFYHLDEDPSNDDYERMFFMPLYPPSLSAKDREAEQQTGTTGTGGTFTPPNIKPLEPPEREHPMKPLVSQYQALYQQLQEQKQQQKQEEQNQEGCGCLAPQLHALRSDVIKEIDYLFFASYDRDPPPSY